MSHIHPTLRRDGDQVIILDQTRLPHEEHYLRLDSLDDAATAIRDMQVRGAPLIGATAAFGVALALRHDASDATLEEADRSLRQTRPTAVNLHWALNRMRAALLPLAPGARAAAAWAEAEAIRLLGGIEPGKLAEEFVRLPRVETDAVVADMEDAFAVCLRAAELDAGIVGLA